MRTAHVRYQGPSLNGWHQGACYEVYFDTSTFLTRVRIGTFAGHNDEFQNPHPTPLKLRSLKRFLTWFTITGPDDHAILPVIPGNPSPTEP